MYVLDTVAGLDLAGDWVPQADDGAPPRDSEHPSTVHGSQRDHSLPLLPWATATAAVGGGGGGGGGGCRLTHVQRANGFERHDVQHFERVAAAAPHVAVRGEVEVEAGPPPSRVHHHLGPLQRVVQHFPLVRAMEEDDGAVGKTHQHAVLHQLPAKPPALVVHGTHDEDGVLQVDVAVPAGCFIQDLFVRGEGRGGEGGETMYVCMYVCVPPTTPRPPKGKQVILETSEMTYFSGLF